MWVCVISNVDDRDWDKNRTKQDCVPRFFILVAFSYRLTFISSDSDAVPLRSHHTLFSFPVGCNVETCLRASHIWQKFCSLQKRTRESHWFTPWQTAIFHSLPQHRQNTSLMCSYEIKCFHRRLTIQPHSHSFHFIRLVDCLLNGLPLPPGKYSVCISFGQNETWLIYFASAHCVFRHLISLSSVQSSVPQVLRYY